jgi:GNAT superfamily N-acetyltransferase
MTETATQQLTVTRLAPPASVDAPDAGAFLEMVRIANAVCRYDAGHDYLDQEPAEMLGFWHDQTNWGQTAFIAERDGRMIGAAKLMYSKEEGAEALDFDLMVDPERWGEGAEEALLAAVENEARSLGRSVVQTWTLHRPGSRGPALEPSTKWGSIPADDRQTRFALDNGFTLEQVERNSAFDLHGSFDLVERMLAEALAFAGDEYRLVTWTSPTPEQYQDSFAFAVSRMSTDAPQGGLVIQEETWDAERVRRRDERLKAQGLTASLACVEHVPSGRIVAYNELVIGEDRSAATQQYGTLVVKEHRGHRLGVIIKCANLLRWRDLVPESPRVSTFNAEENRHMLDINETIGFVPVSYAGAWKKVLV